MNFEDKTKIIAVVGPTASGKTSLAIELAKKIEGEIISCDSMQIYKHMDIGTAKPKENEKKGIPHHLIDIVEPTSLFSCADYKVLAENAIYDISRRKKIPIFCGGTGLYLDSVTALSSFSPSISDCIRAEVQALSPSELWEELLKIDPETASRTHINNIKRVSRAIEIYRGTGKTKSEWDRLSKTILPPYNTLFVGLDFSDRDILYERINKRVDDMLKEGLLDEVSRLNLPRNANSAQAIGYKELYMYIDGLIGYDEAITLLKKNTRNYAKRQLTWFRRNKNIIWFFKDRYSDKDIFEKVMSLAKNHFSSTNK